MSLQKIGILLELIGFFLEVFLAGIILQTAIDVGKDKLKYFSEKCRKMTFMPRVTESPRDFNIGVITIAVVDGVVIWGWLQGNMLFFWIGIVSLLVLLVMVLVNKEARKNLIPPGTKPWLWPLLGVLAFFIISVVLFLCLVPVVLTFLVRLLSAMTLTMGRIKYIKAFLLIVGAIMVLLGLALEFMAAP